MNGRELFQNGHVVPYFVRSEDNVSDGLTKKQPEKLFSVHHNILMNGHLPFCREDVRSAIESMESSGTDGSEYGIPVKSNKSDPNRLNISTTGINPDSNESNPGITKSKSTSAQLHDYEPTRKHEVNCVVLHTCDELPMREAAPNCNTPSRRVYKSNTLINWRYQNDVCETLVLMATLHTTDENTPVPNKVLLQGQPGKKPPVMSNVQDHRQADHGLGHGPNWCWTQDPFVRDHKERTLIESHTHGHGSNWCWNQDSIVPSTKSRIVHARGHGSRQLTNLADDPRLSRECWEYFLALDEDLTLSRESARPI